MPARSLVLSLDLILGSIVLGWHALRLCEGRVLSDTQHALRKASERATPKLNCAEALGYLLGTMVPSYEEGSKSQFSVRRGWVDVTMMEDFRAAVIRHRSINEFDRSNLEVHRSI